MLNQDFKKFIQSLNDKGVFQMSWLEVQRTCLDAKRKHFPVFWNVLRAPKCVAPFRLN